MPQSQMRDIKQLVFDYPDLLQTLNDACIMGDFGSFELYDSDVSAFILFSADQITLNAMEGEGFSKRIFQDAIHSWVKSYVTRPSILNQDLLAKEIEEFIYYFALELCITLCEVEIKLKDYRNQKLFDTVAPPIAIIMVDRLTSENAVVANAIDGRVFISYRIV